MLCYYWYFKDIGYKFKPYACNRCHDLSMMVYDLDFTILNIKGVDYRCFVWNMSQNTAIKLLNNSQLDDKNIMNMDFGANKTSVEVIKEGAFGGTYFRDFYSGVNGKWYRKIWKEFDELKNIDQKFYCSNCCDVSVNKYGIKWRISLRFWENNR